MSFRPVEVGHVDRPDHPSLRDSGCSEKARAAAIYCLLGGGIFGAVWGAAACYQNKYTGVRLLRTIGRSTVIHGGILCGVGFTAFALRCY